MSIRRDPTYLSNDVWRSLWLLAKGKSDEAKHITADEMADTILRQHITEHYPQLLDHQKQIDKLEREVIKTL